MEIAKALPELYPDVIAQGGLANALQDALVHIGSSLRISNLDTALPFVYVHIALGERFSQIYIGATTRMFAFDCWSRGVCLAHGATPDMQDMANAIDNWIASCCSTGELARSFRFVQVEPTAAAYERGEEVEMRWQYYLASIRDDFPELTAFVVAAAAAPTLRQLFPFTSLNHFCFSRCTGYPFTRDTPRVVPRGHDQYVVRDSNDAMLGQGNAADAVALTVAALPRNCGPAIAGTAEQFSGG